MVFLGVISGGDLAPFQTIVLLAVFFNGVQEPGRRLDDQYMIYSISVEIYYIFPKVVIHMKNASRRETAHIKISPPNEPKHQAPSLFTLFYEM